jgi:hypothetical protein
MASDIVERVARAIHAKYGDPSTFDEHDDHWEGLAYAAIEAMREPTDAMLAFKLFYGSGEACQWAPHVWRAMIDEALGDKK